MSIASWISVLILIAIILSSLLAFAIGFYRGLFKTGIKTIVKAALVLIWIFVTPTIAKTLSNIDITKFGIPDFTINNKVITVTTLSETVANVITALEIVSPINGLTIYSFLVTVGELIICYVIFFVMMLLSNLVVDIITTLIYNGVFRWFYQIESFKENLDRLKSEKEYKKNSKALSILAKGLLNSDGTVFDKRDKHPLLKIGGGILGLVAQFAFILVVCSPITALFRIADKNKDDVFAFTKGLVPSQAKVIDDTSEFIDDFSNSALSKIYTLPGGYYLDSLIMNQVSSHEIYGFDINLDSLISSITDVANPIMTSDAISYDEGLSYITYNYATLLSVSTIDAVLTSILLPENSSFYALIPPLIDIGLAMISANTDFTVDILDFSNIDWSDDIAAIQQIYDTVYSLSIESLIAGKDISPYSFLMNTSEYEDNTINTLCNVARVAGSTNVVKKNAGIILNSLGTNLTAYGYDLFPTELEAYNDIDWGEEFYIFAKAFFRLLRLIDIDIEANMNFTKVQENFIKSFRSKEDRDVMKDILLGQDGLLNSKLFSLLKKGDTVLALLNTFLSDNVSGINKYIGNERFIESVKYFNNRDVNEIKVEVSYMFSVVDILADYDNPLHWDENFGIVSRDKFDKDTAQEIYNLLQVARNSVIFSSLYPVVLESYLTNNYSQQQVKDFLFGLTPYNFNYEDENFVDDVSRVILSMPDIVNLYQKIESKSASRREKIEAMNVESIRVFLDVLANSNFFNPRIRYIQSNVEQKNINMEVVLNKLFTSDIFSSFNIVVPSREKIASANWGNGTMTTVTLPSGNKVQLPKDEIGNICLMIQSIKNNTDYFALDLDELRLIDLDHVQSFESIFDLTSAIVNSDLFRESGVSAIVAKIENYFEGKNLNFSFNDLRNYAYEEKNKYKLLDDLYSLKLLSVLFDNLDYNQLSGNTIPYLRTLPGDEFNVFLTTLASTNYNLDSKSDPLANFMYLTLHKFKIFDKYNLPDFSADVFSVKKYVNSVWTNTTEEKVFTINEVEYTFTYTTTGTIRNLCSIYDKLRNDFYISKLKEGDYSPLDFRDWINYEIIREQNYGSSVFSDNYIRKLSDIYGGYIVKKIGKIVKDVPSFFFDAYKYIDTSLIYGPNALDGVTLGQTMYDIDEALVLLTIKISENELVANRMTDFEKIFTLNHIDGQDTLSSDVSSNLKSLGSRKLLSTKASNREFSPMGFYMYSLVSKNSSFAKFLVLGSENENDNLSKVKGIINRIDYKEKSNDIVTNWHVEFNSYGDLILSGNNIDYSFYDYSFTKEVEPLRNIYDSLNNSLLLHQHMIHRIKRICNDFNLNNYIVNSSNNIIHPIKFDTHLTNSIDDREYYSHDYNIIFDLLESDDNALKGILISKELPPYIDSNNAGLVYVLASLNILEDNFNYIIYNLFNNTIFNLSSYLGDPTTKFYLEDDKAIRIKEVMKSNANFDQEKDLLLLQNTLNILYSIKDKSYSSVSNIKSSFNNNFFASLFNSTYETNYRSYIASELAAGLVTKVLSINSEVQSYFSPYSGYNFFVSNNSNYYYITSETGSLIDNLINS